MQITIPEVIKELPIREAILVSTEYAFSILCFALSLTAAALHHTTALAVSLTKRINGKEEYQEYKHYASLSSYQLGRVALNFKDSTPKYSDRVSKENQLELDAHRVAPSYRQPAEDVSRGFDDTDDVGESYDKLDESK